MGTSVRAIVAPCCRYISGATHIEEVTIAGLVAVVLVVGQVLIVALRVARHINVVQQADFLCAHLGCVHLVGTTDVLKALMHLITEETKC